MKKKSKLIISSKNQRFQKKMGHLIMKKRSEEKISQLELAIQCDSDQSHIGKIERGEINVTFQTLLKIARSLNCKIADFTPFP